MVAECQCTICLFRASIHSLWICWLELALLHWEEPKDEIWKGMIIHIYMDIFYWSKPCALKYLYFIDCLFPFICRSREHVFLAFVLMIETRVVAREGGGCSPRDAFHFLANYFNCLGFNQFLVGFAVLEFYLLHITDIYLYVNSVEYNSIFLVFTHDHHTW